MNDKDRCKKKRKKEGRVPAGKSEAYRRTYTRHVCAISITRLPPPPAVNHIPLGAHAEWQKTLLLDRAIELSPRPENIFIMRKNWGSHIALSISLRFRDAPNSPLEISRDIVPLYLESPAPFPPRKEILLRYWIKFLRERLDWFRMNREKCEVFERERIENCFFHEEIDDKIKFCFEITLELKLTLKYPRMEVRW